MRRYCLVAAAFWIAGLVLVLHQVSLPSADAPAPAPALQAQAPADPAETSFGLASLVALLRPFLERPSFPPSEAGESLDPVHYILSHVTPDALTESSAISAGQKITLALDKGDTLLGLLVDADVSVQEAQTAIDALKEVYDPRDLKTGQEISVLFGGNSQFMGLEFAPDRLSSVSVARQDSETFRAAETSKPVERKLVAVQTTIYSSLFDAGNTTGIPAAVMSELLKLYSYNVDFQRDVQPGDSFRVIFERDVTEDGTPVRNGNIVHASMNLSGRELPLYRFEMPDGTVDMFDAKGSSIRKALMRTPIDGARMTSRFGMRRHPILGFSKMHTGIDFGAPTGTPIYAAGDGTLEDIGVKNGYGNYIRIRHTSMISTAYAHMSRFAKGMRRGTRVRQGEVIGYVGSTGRSTGPHLHYEVIRSGRQVNPLSVDMPSGKTLDKKSLRIFEARVNEIGTLFASLSDGRLQYANLRTGASATETE
ncbi:MAG: M23 family metallopeptidase [Pseudomonadota bacterium]|nr:M23 family metallopeptidase [Pseudomonadota bacterium]